MEPIHYYRVGGHLFSLRLSPGFPAGEELAAYEPFRASRQAGEPVLFSLAVAGRDRDLPPAGDEMARFEDENGSMTLFALPDGGRAVHLFPPVGAECCRLYMKSGYRRAMVWPGNETGKHPYGLDTALMMLYAFASAPRDTLLLHASVVEKDGKGYLFLGRSGTGKSTHSRLWIEHVGGSRLLNDDNPVVRIVGGRPWVFGSPWSGKTPCYRNEGVPVGAVVRIRQAPANGIRRLSPVESYASLLTSSSGMAWEKELADGRDRTLQRVAASAPCWMLQCLPDAEAALLCAGTVGKEEPCR